LIRVFVKKILILLEHVYGIVDKCVNLWITQEGGMDICGLKPVEKKQRNKKIEDAISRIL